MGWSNSNLPWAEFERRLSGREPIVVDPVTIEYGDGGDAPAWTRKRDRYQPRPGMVAGESTVDYVELHCHTNFSFLDGASQPVDLVEEAVQLGLSGLAVTDHDGFYGVVQFSAAAREHKLPTVFGAELSLGCRAHRTGSPIRPAGTCWRWPGDPRGTPGCPVPSRWPSWPAARRAGPSTTWTRSPPTCATTCWC